MTFDQIFIDEDYDLRRLARFDELRQQYDAISGAGHTPLIIDLGANVGFSAVYFHLTWPAARIVAVAREKGLIILRAGTHHNVIRTLMPLTIPDEQLEEGLDMLGAALQEVAAAR